MNIFAHIAQNAPQEIFETLLQGENLRIERIVSTGQSSPEDFWYDQTENEWILILQGRAALRLENETEDRVLVRGDYLKIEAHIRHRVVCTSEDEPTIWLAVFYG